MGIHFIKLHFYTKEIEQRTAIGIVGRKPIIQHLNTILDYSLIWIIGIYDHYKIYGDIGFLRRIYEMVLEMLAFCETRINQDGFMEKNTLASYVHTHVAAMPNFGGNLAISSYELGG